MYFVNAMFYQGVGLVYFLLVAGITFLFVYVIHVQHRERVRAEKQYRMVEQQLQEMRLGAAGREQMGQVQLEERLAQAEARYQRLIEELPKPAAVIQERNWEYVNNEALRLLGAEEAGLAGRPVTEWVASEDLLCFKHWLGAVQLAAGLPEPPGAACMQLRMVCADAAVKTVEMKALSIWFKDKPAVLLLMWDISDKNEALKLMVQSEKLTMAGQLAAGIAHEIRNPLTSLKGFLQLMHKSTDKREQYMEIMQEELSRIELIVGELLMVSKPHEMVFRVNNIGKMLRNVALLLHSQAMLNNVEIHLMVSGEPIWVRSDENSLKQVFINMLQNAMDAMPVGGVIRLEAFEQDGQAVIRVADQGCGIKESELNKIGQPFFTTKEKGTGLGLTVSFKIIHSHGGTIQIDSKPGEGTIFTVALPLSPEGLPGEVNNTPAISNGG
ncbi:ATP-binding protein [Paenibacillus sp. y28]|uniref:ATP-binding protein n=1 Tax=Paenibacillus sp. y28 TaxID=3129110 RepID=UPI003018482A